MADPALKMIGASHSQNNSDKSSRKECDKDSSNKPVHDEEYGAILSHHKSMFLVQSHLVQEEGRTTILDNVSMEAHVQVTIGTNHTHNTKDIPSKNNFDKEECGEIVNDEGYDDQDKGA